MVINDKTDPDLPLPPVVDCTADKSKGGAVEELAVDCPADESKGGAVAELAARNVSNPGNGGRLVARCPGRGFPISPKVRLDRRRRGIGSRQHHHRSSQLLYSQLLHRLISL